MAIGVLIFENVNSPISNPRLLGLESSTASTTPGPNPANVNENSWFSDPNFFCYGGKYQTTKNI